MGLLKQLLVLLLIVALSWFCMHLVTEPKTIKRVNVVSQSQLAQEFLQKDYYDKIQEKNEEKHLEKGVKKNLNQCFSWSFWILSRRRHF